MGSQENRPIMTDKGDFEASAQDHERQAFRQARRIAINEEILVLFNGQS